MDLLFFLLIGIVISFLGSIQPGPVNSYVFLYSKDNNKKGAQNVAAGGSVIQGLGALVCSYLIRQFNLKLEISEISLALILILLGIMFLMKKSEITITDTTIKKNYFLQGITLAIINPQVVLFWSFISALLHTNFPFDNLMKCIIFGIGAAIGTFLILKIYESLGTKKYSKNIKNSLIFKSIGVMYSLSGLIKIILL